MPKIFEYIGFIFYFYSNDHDPIHCHVKKGDKEVRVTLYFEQYTLTDVYIVKAHRHTPSLTREEREKIKKFVEVYYPHILDKWETFRAGKKIRPVKISREVK
jgi:hypothetical protein